MWIISQESWFSFFSFLFLKVVSQQKEFSQQTFLRAGTGEGGTPGQDPVWVPVRGEVVCTPRSPHQPDLPPRDLPQTPGRAALDSPGEGGRLCYAAGCESLDTWYVGHKESWKFPTIFRPR